MESQSKVICWLLMQMVKHKKPYSPGLKILGCSKPLEGAILIGQQPFQGGQKGELSAKSRVSNCRPLVRYAASPLDKCQNCDCN